ncbi:alpha/beta hydrolase [Pararhodobacter oceanensis]|uniref:Acetyltransferase n=1 Tax=Pararhodobacter oceanensis TaxID=2172121 RepID=A0A2T8HUM9_9RHOB|nr:alpha/beta hydrolase [Pararhodobacter oceanensis]PVH29115.1 acetyltransferase [Pararhodobacter oceanensis]
MRILTILALSLGLAAPASADCVVLLHGLARSDASMRVLQEVLEFHDYRVINNGYPSEDAGIHDLTHHVGTAAAACGRERLHFVTHSLGGILVRAWLAEGIPDNLGRVVMLAPPNHGSEIVDTLSEAELTRDILTWLNGPASQELGTGADSVPNSLPRVNFELGVIAGDVAISPLGPIIIDGPNDGTVSVASTRIAGMRDHMVINASHTLIMNNPVAMAEVLEFLRNGVFDHGITLPAAIRKLLRR